MRKQLVRTSKFLSLVLRHDPSRIGLALDPNGWAKISELLRHAKAAGHPIPRKLLTEIVETNEKRRFTISSDGLRIRANQGHSLPVDLELEQVEPPALLFHGTATRHLESIQEQGLVPGARQHVHLSVDAETATRVGQRHGKPVVLKIAAGSMHEAGFAFFLSANGVWLTASVPVAYIRFPGVSAA